MRQEPGRTRKRMSIVLHDKQVEFLNKTWNPWWLQTFQRYPSECSTVRFALDLLADRFAKGDIQPMLSRSMPSEGVQP